MVSRGKDKPKTVSKATSQEQLAPAGSDTLAQTDRTAMVDFQAIESVPRDMQKRILLGKELGAQISCWWQDSLSAEDWALVERYGLSPPDEVAGLRIRAALAEIIFEQARILGPRIFVSDTVVNLLLQWFESTKNGPQLFKRLGEALALGARVIRGQAKMPLDKKLYPIRQTAQVEIKALQNRLRAHLAGLHRQPQGAELCRLIHKFVEPPQSPFPWLRQVRTALLRFLDQQPEMASGLASGERTPADFVDVWFAWSHHRDPEAMRQAISKLGRSRRRSQT